MARSWIVTLVGCTTIVALANDARADEPVGHPSRDPQIGALHPVLHDDDPHDEFAAFPLVQRHEKHYLRAGIEVGSVVVVGFIDYLLNTSDRGGLVRAGDKRWDLRYSWDDLRGKFTGSAYELDANKFTTNYVGHPFAGTCYYEVARSNHLSFAESAIFSILGSTTWEFFGEIREKVSVNDMIATPMAGVAIGESTMQMSGFFSRGKKNVPNQALAFLFAPLKRINELFDGVEQRRDEHTDVLGFPAAPWHRFEVYAGGGTTIQESSRTALARSTGGAYPDVRFGIDMNVANLPGYRGAARHSRLFDDGNVSSVSFTGIWSKGSFADLQFATRIVPVGYYYRDARLDERGRVSGFGAVVGLRMGFEYGMHDFDRDRLRGRDLVSIVSPLGISVENTFERGRVQLRTGFDIAGSLSGLTPYALSDYRSEGRRQEGLLTAVRNNGYYHALGVTASPFVEASLGALRLETRLRFDAFRAIEGFDENPGVDRSLDITDRRAIGSAALGWRPSGLPLNVSVGVERRERAGDLGGVHAQRGETSLFGRAGLVF